ncbi:hypothetical protein [Salibacterium lacus]|uniref:DUF3955 domain-containing protein n=1 Tax=Salibacterium lacus TaxID=1898109 RepID=A0ABW5T553_9BACI
MGKIMYFVLGICVSLLVLPFLYRAGVPTFDVVLRHVFGEGSIWAVFPSLLLILLVFLGIRKAVKQH